MSMMGVYAICNLFDGRATAYIGSSKDIERRWRDHVALLRSGRHPNPYLQAAWDKYGEAAFEFYVIEEVANEADLLAREQYWLDRYLENPDACYNIARCAEAPMRDPPEETRRKMSESHRGRTPWNKGKNMDAEFRRRASEAARKRWASGKYKNRRKRRLTEEHRNKISKALKGRRMSEKSRRKVAEARAKPYPALIHRETGEIIPAGYNLCKMCREQGLNQRNIWFVVRGKRQSHKGWELLREAL